MLIIGDSNGRILFFSLKKGEVICKINFYKIYLRLIQKILQIYII